MPRTPRKRTILAGAVAIGAVAAVAVTVARRDDSETLDTQWGQPDVVDVGSSGSPLDVLAAAMSQASEPVRLGQLALDPALPVIADLERQPSAETGANGLVPTWFPVPNGAVQVQLSVEGRRGHDGDTTTSYAASQTSLVATSATADEVADTLRDFVDDGWPDIDDGSYERIDDGGLSFTVSARSAGGTTWDSINVSTAASVDVPGLVVVEVSTHYEMPGSIRTPPQVFTAAGADAVRELASTGGWPLRSWSRVRGLGLDGSTRNVTDVSWTARGTEPRAVADAVVERLGVPDDGDVGNDSAWLEYAEGGFSIVTDDGATEVDWSSHEMSNDLVESGPVTARGHGSPIVSVDVDSAGPVDIGVGRPVLDAIADFEQAGMIAIDGAVTIDATSSVFGSPVRRPGATYLHVAEQEVLVDSALTPGEVADRIFAALADLGIERTESRDETYFVDAPGIGFDFLGTFGIPGQPVYAIEVGTSKAHPGLVAVWVQVTVELVGAAPPPPALADDYFADAQAAGDAEGWEPTRWYVEELSSLFRDRVEFRGELGWVTPERGPDGLAITVDTLTEVSGVAADGTRADFYYWFESDDDWRASLMDGDTYEPVEVMWEGRPLDVGHGRDTVGTER